MYLQPRKLKLKWKHGTRSMKSDYRQTLDIPTTDPGTDLLFSTDEECLTDSSGGCVTLRTVQNGSTAFTMPPVYRRIPYARQNLLQSDLQRRYIEEIGDGFIVKPPKILITSPRTNDLSFTYKIDKAIKPVKLELPSLHEQHRRTHSCHSLQGSKKHMTKSNMHSSDTKRNIPNTSDEMTDIKLSLRKKIWNGTQIEDGMQHLAIERRKQLSQLPAYNYNEGFKDERYGSGFPYATASRNIHDFGSKSFFTACTQKLMEWQSKRAFPNKYVFSTDEVANNSVKACSNTILNDINESKTIRIFKRIINKEEEPKFIQSNTSTTKAKSKHKINHVPKKLESTRKSGRLLKKKSDHSLARRKSSKTNYTKKAPDSPKHLMGFKAGSFIVTALQNTSEKKKQRRLKAGHDLNVGPQDAKESIDDAGPTILQKQVTAAAETDNPDTATTTANFTNYATMAVTPSAITTTTNNTTASTTANIGNTSATKSTRKTKAKAKKKKSSHAHHMPEKSNKTATTIDNNSSYQSLDFAWPAKIIANSICSRTSITISPSKL